MGSARAGKPVIGIVGGVGAGKSTVAAEFAKLGCALVAGDAIGREMLADETVRGQLRRRWGNEIFSPKGVVDRQALAQIVFADDAELECLNRILHPRIRRRMGRRIAEAQRDPRAPAIVMDAALLFEAGWDDLCSHVVFVAAPARLRSRRAQAARGWDSAAWREREKSQISLDKKAERCDYIIDNSSSVSCLRERIRSLFYQIVSGAARP